MAVPTTYADLGKSARDVFTMGYGFGLIKLDLKTKSENALEFTSSGLANMETTKVMGKEGEHWCTVGTEIIVFSNKVMPQFSSASSNIFSSHSE
uniref:Voltage-dependent anion-selective channel protein 1 n=1 Tax=Sus scrofa TaxID=9823 RepID=A0A8D0YB47_PIG